MLVTKSSKGGCSSPLDALSILVYGESLVCLGSLHLSLHM